MMTAYHSALQAPIHATPRNEWTDGRSTAFVHNILDSDDLPVAYLDCDVLYADPPWPAGYDVFAARVGAVTSIRYGGFMHHVRQLVRRHGAPAVLIGAHAALAALKPDLVRHVTLNGAPAWAACFRLNLGDLPEGADAHEVLDYLAARYRRVGDFFCGCGRAPEIFTRAGGSFVASDFNAECVGYIAAAAPAWSTQAL